MKIHTVVEYSAAPEGNGLQGVEHQIAITHFYDKANAQSFAETSAWTFVDNTDRGRIVQAERPGELETYLWEVYDAQFPDNPPTENEDEYLVAQVWIITKEKG